jgi:hypothetical protein
MEETTIDVPQDPSPAAGPSAPEQIQEPAPVLATEPEQKPKGSQTPPEFLYAALAEERELRKQAEAKLAEITPVLSTDEVFSDEGKAIKGEVETLKERLEQFEDAQRLKDLQSLYPALKDKTAEFEDYRKDFPRHKLENVAKLFLTENGLMQVTQERKGLEQPSGGGHRDAVSLDMTADDAKTLRETNYKKYLELLHAGKLQNLK